MKQPLLKKKKKKKSITEELQYSFKSFMITAYSVSKADSALLPFDAKGISFTKSTSKNKVE